MPHAFLLLHINPLLWPTCMRQGSFFVCFIKEHRILPVPAELCCISVAKPRPSVAQWEVSNCAMFLGISLESFFFSFFYSRSTVALRKKRWSVRKVNVNTRGGVWEPARWHGAQRCCCRRCCWERLQLLQTGSRGYDRAASLQRTLMMFLHFVVGACGRRRRVDGSLVFSVLAIRCCVSPSVCEHTKTKSVCLKINRLWSVGLRNRPHRPKRLLLHSAL